MIVSNDAAIQEVGRLLELALVLQHGCNAQDFLNILHNVACNRGRGVSCHARGARMRAPAATATARSSAGKGRGWWMGRACGLSHFGGLPEMIHSHFWGMPSVVSMGMGTSFLTNGMVPRCVQQGREQHVATSKQ